MPDLNDLYFYVQVVDHGGFAVAGRALGIPKSRLSRRLAELERRLGVRLIQRSTRQFGVTEIGHRYYRHCKAMLVEAEAAEAAIAAVREEPSGTLRIACPVALLHLHVSQMLAEFLVHYPRVSLCLEANNRRVEILGEGVDLALRARSEPLADSELVQKVLGRRRQILVASPGLLQQVAPLEEPSDLAAMPSMGSGTLLQQDHRWDLRNDKDQELQIIHQPRFATTDLLTLRDAAVAGVGVVQLPQLLVRDALSAGTLVQVLPAWTLRDDLIHAVFPSRRGLLPALRHLLDFLAERFATLEEGPETGKAAVLP